MLVEFWEIKISCLLFIHVAANTMWIISCLIFIDREAKL